MRPDNARRVKNALLGGTCEICLHERLHVRVWRKPQTAESPETRMVVGSPTWARTRLLRRSTPFSHGSDHQIVEEV